MVLGPPTWTVGESASLNSYRLPRLSVFSNYLRVKLMFDQGKVLGNARNTLNSIWLNNANQCLPNLIHKRSYSTDLRDRDTLSLSNTP